MSILWMGEVDTWNVVTLADNKIAEGQKMGRFLAMPADSDLPPLWYKDGNTGVVEISGSLVDGSAGWMRLFGVTGYADITNAALQAAQDPDVKNLMFKVGSGGGMVHGLAEFSADIHKISQMKPSLTYTSNTMASAAYWSGSSVAGPIVMAPTAEVGSLGVLKVSRNISKQLEMDGVAVTIHRAGEMKARDNPFEELTPEAKAHLDSQLADLHGMFKSAVKKNRPGMSADMLKEATDGRTFLGQRAVTAGLADSLGSYDMALKLLDKSSRKKDTSSNFKGASMNMTPAQMAKYQAALAGGATIEAALQAAGVVATAEQIAEMTTAAAEFKAEQTRLTDEAAAAAALAATAAAAAKPGAPDTSALDLLKSQLATSQAAERAASNELAALKATTQTSATNHTGLLAIARKALAHMLIPMGGSSASADAMDATAVIAEHARVEPLYQAKFPAGRVSKDDSADDKDTKAEVPAEFAQRLAMQNQRKES